MTKKTFIDGLGDVPQELAQAVIKQIGGWAAFKEAAANICYHGIDGGFSGFIYYWETVPFALQNRCSILKLAKRQAENIGIGVLEMVQGFGCLGKDWSIDEIAVALFGADDDSLAGGNTVVLNALAWYAAEETARELENQVCPI